MDRSAVDPYIRLSVGVGKETQESASTARGGVALGLRYFVSENTYLSLDTEYAAYTFVASSTQSESGNEILDSINETNVHFGVGYAW